MYHQKPLLGIQLNHSHPLARGLVGYWLLNEGSGNLANDATRNNEGTFVGSTVVWSPTQKGPGVFSNGNGVTDRIDLGSITQSNPLSCYDTQAISIVARIYKDSSFTTNVWPRIIDKSSAGSAADGWAFMVEDANDRMVFFSDEDGSDATASSLPLDVVVDVAVTYNVLDGKGFHYVDGRFINTGACNTAIPSVTTNAAIANWNHATDRQWEGFILFVSVWNRGLSAAEVAWLHREPYAMFEPTFPIELMYPQAVVAGNPWYYYAQQ